MRYSKLKKQIERFTGQAGVRGVVTGRVADRLQIATPAGLKEFAAVAGVTPGDHVTIIAGAVTKQSGKNAEEYFV